jgi:hypoxanthine-guanine phosphoribosyltransferase
MITNTRSRIVDLIRLHGKVRAHFLHGEIGISKIAIHKQLKRLLEDKVIEKTGKPPKVYYYLKSDEIKEVAAEIDEKTKKIIDERYLYITPGGESKYGWEGFLLWCAKTRQEPVKTARDYIKTLKKFDSVRTNGLIDGMPKVKKTFNEVFLDKLFYLDFYSIERFGKTRLGQMLLYAKQSQNVALIKKLVEEIDEKVASIVKKHKIDGVLFVPPTVKREVQLMKELEKRLKLQVRRISAAKIRTDIVIPQKTLSKLEDRIDNASHTIAVEDTNGYKNILLIDDAVGSGATINETARQIKSKNMVKGEIIGLAITGSFKGFDVISEV